MLKQMRILYGMVGDWSPLVNVLLTLFAPHRPRTWSSSTCGPQPATASSRSPSSSPKLASWLPLRQERRPTRRSRRSRRAATVFRSRSEPRVRTSLCHSPASTHTLCFADYISNRRLLLSLADAGGRLMLSWKDLSELAGSTSRVYTLLSTLHDLSTSTYTALPRPADLAPDAPFYDLGTLNGRFIDDAPAEEGVTLDKVPIVAPAPGVARGGEELVHQLSVKVKPGEHLLITGGNGTGKTAIARVLAGASHFHRLSRKRALTHETAGLWPVWDGVVVRPDDTKIMFLPQRPYLSSGSLRDQ